MNVMKKDRKGRPIVDPNARASEKDSPWVWYDDAWNEGQETARGETKATVNKPDPDLRVSMLSADDIAKLPDVKQL